MTNSNNSKKWKYFALMITCAIFLYFFTNYSLLRPSPSAFHNKEYCIGVLLLVICFLNAFVLHPLFYQQNKKMTYVVCSFITVVVALFVEFSWLYSDIMGCLTDTLTPKESHSYFLGCVFFVSLRNTGLLSFTFLICEFFRNRAKEKTTEKLLLELDDKLLVKDITDNLVLLNYKSIRYCEQEQNVTKIYGKKDDVYFRYGSLKDLQNLCEKDYFVQINRKTLIAKRLMKKYSNGQLWLDNEDATFEVTPSFQNQSSIKQLEQNSMVKEGEQHQEKDIITDNKKAKAVLLLIANNPGVSAVKISNLSHFSPSTVNRILKQLKDEGLIEYVGSKKTGGYRALSPNIAQ